LVDAWLAARGETLAELAQAARVTRPTWTGSCHKFNARLRAKWKRRFVTARRLQRINTIGAHELAIE
jgi:hypothetical protein